MYAIGSEPAVAHAARNDREQAELIGGLYGNTPVGVAGALFGVLVLSWVLLDIAPERAPWVWGWVGLSLVSAAWQLFLWAWRRRADPDADWRPWARRFFAASLIEGIRWGAGVLLLPEPGAAEQQLWVTMVVACAASSSVSSLGSYLPAFYALLFPAMTPIALLGLLHPDPRHWGMSLLALVLTLTIAWLGLRQNRSLVGALRLRFENLDLVDDLRRQKDVAEQANIAKSQFLAAASHDLRQPIHSLGLFLGALGRERMSKDARRLTRHISEAIEAMMGLFDALLDLSQLDAGVVRPAVKAFALDPLVERICNEQAAVQGRPVTLRRVPTSLIVVSDPLLLERMIRNLVANAVRHTREGRILVGCRRGTGVALEVWDTGPGISAADREKIFEEYIQLGNPERDRTRGLGLGLAITRRLSHLLDCPVGLRSTPGKGSAFRISMPRADAVTPDAAPWAEVVHHAGLVLVVDDEQAVREATCELLQTWGFDVVAAASGDELLARLHPQRSPDLLICDWRLRGHETGREVIARICAACGKEIPALLITGDTAPTRLKEADRAGFALLHKPVPPAKLRAMVGNLIRKGADAARPEDSGESEAV